LLETGRGRWFVRQYYRYSPPFADFIAERDWLKALVRLVLLPLILLVSSPFASIAVLLSSLAGAIAVLRRLRTIT
ncbi:MAG: CFI-box-CTERM domain-containing protein, partial [Halioglobus sp.]